MGKLTKQQMIEFITKVAMDCGQVSLGSNCGKYFNLMYDACDRIMVESFEKNNTYGFTNINDLHPYYLRRIYNDLKIDFA